MTRPLLALIQIPRLLSTSFYVQFLKSVFPWRADHATSAPSGGPPRRLCTFPSGFLSLSWGPVYSFT